MEEGEEKPKKQAVPRKHATAKQRDKGKPAPKTDPSSLAETRVTTEIIKREARTIAREIFNIEMGSVKKDVADQKTFSIGILIGVVIATFLVIVALLFSLWLFMGGYNEHYLDAETRFLEETSRLREDNAAMRREHERLFEVDSPNVIRAGTTTGQ